MQGEHSISAPPMPVARQFTAVAIFFFVGLAFYLNTMRVKDAPVVWTMGIKVLAESIRQTGGEDCPLTYVYGPFALQFYLNTKRPEVSFEQAAALLRSNTAAYVKYEYYLLPWYPFTVLAVAVAVVRRDHVAWVVIQRKQMRRSYFPGKAFQRDIASCQE